MDAVEHGASRILFEGHTQQILWFAIRLLAVLKMVIDSYVVLVFMTHICIHYLMLFSRLILLSGIFGCAIVHAADVRHYPVEIQVIGPERSQEYCPTLLRMILNASKAPDEVIDFTYIDRHFSQARWLAEVENSNVNAPVWAVTTKEREQLLRPIRIPIFKGLIGWRTLMIRKDDQGKFSNVNTVKDLAKLKAGQGIRWPDAEILESNGLPVILGAGTENLYKMLKARRFDYFPRGVHEVFPDSKYIHANDVVQEQELLIYYPSAAYFFVNKKNTELAERIEKGWEIILNNGEFDKFFFNHPQIIAALEDLKRHKRKILRLENPLLPKETPLDNPDYWLDLSKYQF